VGGVKRSIGPDGPEGPDVAEIIKQKKHGHEKIPTDINNYLYLCLKK
jgi:hypothetical protein